MLFGRLAFIFEVMIYVGLGLPLVNLLMGFISGLGHDGGLGHSGADFHADTSGGTDFFHADASGGTDFLHTPDHMDIPSDIHAGDIHIPHADVAHSGFVVRFNMYCLCLALVIQGAVGVFATTSLDGSTRILFLIFGFIFAVTAYILFYRIVIYSLKKNDAEALHTKNLTFRHANVTFRILADSPGKIQTVDHVGAVISFLAELDPDICKANRINEGEEVIITNFIKEQNLCYVTLPIVASEIFTDK